ncbi:DNA-directed RNA polymerase 7 kDa subunit, partial [Monkeypox virus]
QPLLDIN